MTEKTKTPAGSQDDTMKITVTKNGPYIVTGAVPLTTSEICNDDEGYCRTWREVKRYPVQEKYALCRCGQSKNKPFCDGTHAKISFEGTEAGDHVHFDKEGLIINNGIKRKGDCYCSEYACLLGALQTLIYCRYEKY